MTLFNVCLMRLPDFHWASAFFELGELIAHSLADNGYSAQITENYLDPNGRNLIIGCHLIDIAATPQIPPDTIILNTEPVGIGLDLWNERIYHFLRKFPSWDYSTENIFKLEKLGISPPKYLKIGYHPRLNRIPDHVEKDIDVLFYGGLSEVRLNVLNKIEKSGLRVKKLVGVYGSERDEYVSRSKIVLNLHQHVEANTFEIVRVSYLMNNKKAIVSQFDQYTKMDVEYKNGLILSKYDDIVEHCINTIESDDTLIEYERKSLETIMQFDSVKIIGDLLST